MKSAVKYITRSSLEARVCWVMDNEWWTLQKQTRVYQIAIRYKQIVIQEETGHKKIATIHDTGNVGILVRNVQTSKIPKSNSTK